MKCSGNWGVVERRGQTETGVQDNGSQWTAIFHKIGSVHVNTVLYVHGICDDASRSDAAS